MTKNQNFKGEVCPHCQLRFLPGLYDEHVSACKQRVKVLSDSAKRFRDPNIFWAKTVQPQELTASVNLVRRGGCYSPPEADIFRAHQRKPSRVLFSPFLGKEGVTGRLTSGLSHAARQGMIREDIKRLRKDPTLTPQQRKIITHRFTEPYLSQEETGRKLGINQKAVSKQEKVLVKKLRQIIEREQNSPRKHLKLQLLTKIRVVKKHPFNEGTNFEGEEDDENSLEWTWE